MPYTPEQCTLDASILVYASRVNGDDGFRKEYNRLIFDRNLSLADAETLLLSATEQLNQLIQSGA